MPNRAVKLGVLTLVLALLVTNAGRAIQEPTYEQRMAIWEDFSKWNKAVGITSTAYQEFLGTKASQELIDGYGSSVFILKLHKELLLTGDLAAAWRLVEGRIADGILKKIAPGFNSWLGWFSAAKAGMELFKDLVFDPMIEQSQLDTYFGLRDQGYEPETAYASLRSIGHMMERAKVEFRKQRGDDPFVPGTNDLRPEVRPQFERYMRAGIETKYQEKLHREFLQKFAEEARLAEQRLPQLREELLMLLRHTRIGRIDVEPARVELRPGEQVALTALAVYADPSAPRSAREVTAEAVWSGGTDGNIFVAGEEHAGQTVLVTAEYAHIPGTAFITVVTDRCGDDGRWDATLQRCICHGDLVWNEDLGECIPREDDVDAEAEEILGDLEVEFYEAVRVFEEHYGDFRARLQSLGGESPDVICGDGTLAFSFARAAAAYSLVDAYLEAALALVGDRDPEVPLHYMDEIRLALIRKDHGRVQEQTEAMPDLLDQYAPGCDAEEVLDAGARIAEGDQDAETGIDITGADGASGGIGPSGDGALRFVQQGTPFHQESSQGGCSGASINLSVTSIGLPTEIRADASSYTVTVAFSWSATGYTVEDVSAVVAVNFMGSPESSPEYETWSGSRSLQFVFDRNDVDFSQMANTVTIAVSAGIMCEGGGAEYSTVQHSQFYLRQGSE